MAECRYCSYRWKINQKIHQSEVGWDKFVGRLQQLIRQISGWYTAHRRESISMLGLEAGTEDSSLKGT